MMEHRKTSLDITINQHIKEKNHSFNFDNVKIFDIERHMRKRRQSNDLHIFAKL